MTTCTTTRRSVWMLAASLATLAACGDATAPDGGATNLSVSFAAQNGTTALPTNAAGQAIVVGTSNDTLIINSIQLVLNDVELKRADVTSCPDAMPARRDGEKSSDTKGCSRLDLGPMLVNLPLTEAGASKLAVSIPAGSYKEIEFELDDVDNDDDASAAEKALATQYPDFVDQTVRVTGSFRGQPFTFTSKVEAEVEFEFNPALVVEAGVNDNITVTLDLARWFKDSAGALLVPSSTTRSRIEQNIETSFDVFGDRDRDGKEDSSRGRKRERSRKAMTP